MPAYSRSTTHSNSTHTSDQATNYQLEVSVVGKVVSEATRFVADDSLSVLKMHRVGHPIIINPVIASLQNNCTVLRIELQTL